MMPETYDFNDEFDPYEIEDASDAFPFMDQSPFFSSPQHKTHNNYSNRIQNVSHATQFSAFDTQKRAQTLQDQLLSLCRDGLKRPEIYVTVRIAFIAALTDTSPSTLSMEHFLQEYPTYRFQRTDALAVVWELMRRGEIVPSVSIRTLCQPIMVRPWRVVTRHRELYAHQRSISQCAFEDENVETTEVNTTRVSQKRIQYENVLRLFQPHGVVEKVLGNVFRLCYSTHPKIANWVKWARDNAELLIQWNLVPCHMDAETIIALALADNEGANLANVRLYGSQWISCYMRLMKYKPIKENGNVIELKKWYNTVARKIAIRFSHLGLSPTRRPNWLRSCLGTLLRHWDAPNELRNLPNSMGRHRATLAHPCIESIHKTPMNQMQSSELDTRFGVHLSTSTPTPPTSSNLTAEDRYIRAATLNLGGFHPSWLRVYVRHETDPESHYHPLLSKTCELEERGAGLISKRNHREHQSTSFDHDWERACHDVDLKRYHPGDALFTLYHTAQISQKPSKYRWLALCVSLFQDSNSIHCNSNVSGEVPALSKVILDETFEPSLSISKESGRRKRRRSIMAQASSTEALVDGKLRDLRRFGVASAAEVDILFGIATLRSLLRRHIVKEYMYAWNMSHNFLVSPHEPSLLAISENSRFDRPAPESIRQLKASSCDEVDENEYMTLYISDTELDPVDHYEAFGCKDH